MGALDRPELFELSNAVRETLRTTAAQHGVVFSEFAEEIATLLLVSVAYEPSPPGTGEPLTLNFDSEAFFNQVVGSVDDAVNILIEQSHINERDEPYRGLVTSPDIFHWLENGANGLSVFDCIFPSTF
jgi:hypothetical protein